MGDSSSSNGTAAPGSLLTCLAAQSYLQNNECGVTLSNGTSAPAGAGGCPGGEGNSSSSSPTAAPNGGGGPGGTVLTLNFLTETSGK
jgi:hypothetical protein